MGLPGIPKPARERLMEVTSEPMAPSCPNTTSRSRASRSSSLLRSEVETLCVGMRAILATIFSMSAGLIFLRWVEPDSRTRAPASSMTSIALSGR